MSTSRQLCAAVRTVERSCRWVSSWSSSSSADGPNAATWRLISEPIEPPAPVMSTRLSADQLGDGGEVGDHLFAPEQIVDPDLAHVLEPQAGADDLLDRGDDPQGHAGRLGVGRDPLDQLPARRRHREQHLVRFLPGDHGSQIGRVAAHRDPEHLLALHAGVVVDEADRDEAAPVAGQHLPGQRRPGRAGSDQDDPQAALVLFHPPTREEAGLEAHGPHQERGERRRRR